jgi:hypothetical protein
LSDYLEGLDPAHEVDIEGLDYHQHYLWVVGSHSTKRKRPKADEPVAEGLKRLQTVEREPNRYFLARIPWVAGELHRQCPHPDDPEQMLTAGLLKRKKHSNQLLEQLKRDEHLRDFVKAGIPSKDNGLDIEGLAVMEAGSCNESARLLLGLRGPVLRGYAVLLELELKPHKKKADELLLKTIGSHKRRYKKHFLNLAGLGIRELCIWEHYLLILAGPTMVLDGGIQIFKLPLDRLATDSDSLQFDPLEAMGTVPHGQGNDRAEGLCVDPEQPALLIAYDAPAPERKRGHTQLLLDTFDLH